MRPCTMLLCLLLCLGAAATALSAQAGPATTTAPAPAADQTPFQAAVSRSVCTVTVENKWGIPMGTATGFLLTDGRFAITDLGLVSQPSAAQATLRFTDGTTAVCREFAMADGALGLVALRLADETPGRAGLPLASGLPPLDGSAVVSTAGWRWASKLDVVSGRLFKGPAIKDAAVRAHVDTPVGVDSFARADGPRLETATGSVLLDSEGTVLGTVLEVTIRGTSAPLAIPSSTLRAALISTQPQLRPLTELPKSPWPTRFVRVPGQPSTASAFSKEAAQVKKAMICPTCSGKGKTVVALDAPAGGGGGRGGGGWGGGGRGGGGGGNRGGNTGGGGQGNVPGNAGRNGLDTQFQPCKTCAGERYVMGTAVWADLIQLVELGTRINWAPTTDERTRLTCRKDMASILKSLVIVGRRFDRAFNTAVATDLAQKAVSLPCGTVFRAEVKEHLDGPDGKYILLAPLNSDLPVAVRLDDVIQLGGKSTLGDRKDPADGSWVLVCGMALAPFDSGQRQGRFVLPLEWMPVPVPAPADAAAEAAAPPPGPPAKAPART